MRKLFTDREFPEERGLSEKVTKEAYNGITLALESRIPNFAFKFSYDCADTSTPYATNVNALKDSIRAIIPKLEYPLNPLDYDREIEEQDKYNLFDLIEYLYPLVQDIKQDEYHSYYRHYHLVLLQTTKEKDSLRGEINLIFRRNNLNFYLDLDGEVKRRLPRAFDELVSGVGTVNIKDDDLSSLIKTALNLITKPSEYERKLALEKLWDAFERVKTIKATKQGEKRESAKELTKLMANSTPGFEEIINDEFMLLSKLGNNYQIRHFETYITKIPDLALIDYLFFRALSLINLAVVTIEEPLPNEVDWWLE
ncbi:hypothetical protein CPY53_04050 [Paenibacillus polymyxa]|uniref:AbiJ-NTD4 domain-containing protein n=1 Tax=Paenibacillus polymyxa TaxID=1406 RepID=UPI001F580602|nr:hypothetical protein [Paenibacillus polymyxa]UNL92779.1 hypothetical protein CPY53_04050 [Paenibacillus polymyxa]